MLRELTFMTTKPAEGNRAGRPTKETYEVRPDGRGAVLPSSRLRGYAAKVSFQQTKS